MDKPGYRAFLSYSHADTRIARKVHARLEGFRIDKDLVGRATAQGPVPASLRPIFRDRNDFSAGHALDDQTLAALDASAALIVLASPNAASSRYVDEEIRLFKTRHPERPVIPLIVAGAIDAGESDYFPPALRFTIADGTVSQTPAHVLAADLREHGDGFLLAIAKVVARLIDVSPDLVFRRAERERRRQVRLRAAFVSLVGVLALIGGVFFWQSHEQKRTLAEIDSLVRRYSVVGPATAGRTQSLTQAFTSIAEGAATDPRYAKALDLLKQGNAAAAEPLLKAVAEDKARRAEKDAKDAAAAYRDLAVIAAVSDPARARDFFAKAVQLDPSNVEGLMQSAAFQSAAGNLDVAEKAYRRVVETAKPGDDDFYVFYARLGLSELQRTRGHLDAAVSGYRAARLFAEQRAAKNPKESIWQFAVALSTNAVGEPLVAQGKLPEALACYRSSQAILERIVKAKTALPAQQILATSLANTGSILFAQGDIDGALRSYEAGRGILIEVSKEHPEAVGLRRELVVSQTNIGDILLTRGRLQEAQTAYEAGQATADRIAAGDPANSMWQRDRAIGLEKIGDVQKTRGNLAGALRSYEAAHGIVTPQTRKDPANGLWQKELSLVTSRIASVRMAQGDAAGTLDAYTAANDVLQRLAAADPANLDLRNDLAVSYRDIGSTLLALGQLPRAIAAYRRSLDIAESVVQNAGDNANYQRDVEVANNRLGNAFLNVGDLPSALQAFRKGDTIAEKLAALSPDNSDWQRDRSIAKNNIGGIFAAQGKSQEALTAFRAALDIGLSLARSDPHNAGWQTDLAHTYRSVGTMQVALNDLADAEASFRAGLLIAKRRAETATDNVEVQNDLAISLVKIGGVEETQKKLDAALKSFEAAHAIVAKRAASAPNSQNLLPGILGRIGGVQLARNQTAAALDAFQAELESSERLATIDPANASWQHQLALAYGHLAIVYDRMKRDADARDALEKGRDVLVRLTASHPGWADWKDDLAWFDQRIAAGRKPAETK